MARKLINKKRILKTLGILSFGIVPIVLSSCSSTSTLISRTVSKNDGSLFETYTTLKEQANYALNSDTGMKEFLKGITDDLILNWLYRLSQTSNVSFSNSYNNQRTQINEDYKDLVDSYKKTHGSSWALKFQQEVLDPVGGTEDAYKKDKWHSWATSQFETYLFNTDYLTYKDANGNIVEQSQLSSKTVSDLYTALKNQNFQFAVPTSNTNDYDAQYAKFMQYIWDQYVQIENPYVVNMSLWKYGTPTQGLGSLYTHAESTTTTQNEDSSNSDSSSGEDSGSTTTTNTGSYIYPYFGNDSSTSSTSATGTLTKFANFVSAANSVSESDVTLPSTGNNSSSPTSSKVKIPFKSTYDSDGYGLLYIPNSYTDDSSTYILAKNTSIYSDLYIEFAAASSYLFWRNSGITGTDVNMEAATTGTTSGNYGIPSIDKEIEKDISNSSVTSDPTSWVDSTTGLDKLTGQFVSTADIFTGSSGKSYGLQLDKSYVNQIINPNGSLKSLLNKDLYVVDSFIPKNNNLTNFMMLRNSAGVHAISIDGYYYVNGASEAKSTLTTAEKKKRAGQVVLFRSLYNNLTNKNNGESDYSFSIDVQSELKTFYTNNLTWLIYNYAQQTDQTLFDMKALTSLSDSEKTLATSINNYLHEISYYTKTDDYNKALYNGKSTYSANYGIDAYKNGLAAPWTYQSFTDTDSNKYDSNPIISFQVGATASIVKNPFDTTTTSSALNYDGSTYVSNTSLKSSVTALTNNLNVLSNVSFEGFRYSQYIYSNLSYVNSAMNAFASEGSNLANLVKINYLKRYVSNYFDESTLQFKTVFHKLIIKI
ncbi:DUF3713 domain-containing protein [Malacoplasma penetrans]|uniref:DUF3713 domain-containing protein n=1 Tax=Malacoplasma penetrans TaxID=28227 RepID=UPI001E3222CE|nr:DUF3713 domain-containing protein [Malacoplasma penetrans]